MRNATRDGREQHRSEPFSRCKKLVGRGECVRKHSLYTTTPRENAEKNSTIAITKMSVCGVWRRRVNTRSFNITREPNSYGEARDCSRRKVGHARWTTCWKHTIQIDCVLEISDHRNESVRYWSVYRPITFTRMFEPRHIILSNPHERSEVCCDVAPTFA